MGNLPINGNLPIEAKGIPNIGWSNSQYRLQDLPVVGIATVFTLDSIVCTYNHITVWVSLKLGEGHILSTSLQPSTIEVYNKSLYFFPLFLEIYRRVLHLWRRSVGKCERYFKCDCLSIFVRSLQKWNQILQLLWLQRRWEKLPSSFVIK